MENTKNVADLVRIESDSFSQETRNRADGLIPEILERSNAESLADLTETQLENFRYMSNLHADSEVYRLLLIRRQLSRAGISVPRHYNF